MSPEDIEAVTEGDSSLKGHCTVQLKSGFILGGYWVNGRRKGPGICLAIRRFSKVRPTLLGSG